MAKSFIELQRDAVKELRAQYNDFLRAAEEYGEKSKEAVFYERELLKAANEKFNIKIKEVQQYEVIAGHVEKLKQSEKELKEIKAQESRLNKFIRGDIESIYEVKEKELRLAEDELELKRVTEEIDEKEYERQRKVLRDKDRMYASQVMLTRQTKIGVTAATGLRNQFGGATEAIRLMATTRGSFKAIAMGITSVVNPMSLLLNLMQGYIDRIKELDSARVSFNQQTGALDRYKNTLESAYRSNIRYNVSLQEQAMAFSNLHKNMTTFSGLSKDTQKDLATFTGRLQKGLGIDAVGGLETLNRTMGMSASMSKSTFESMIKEADQFNLNIQEIANGVKANADNIAVYGSRGVKVYMELAKRSKALGIEMGKLHSMSQQFLDFEQASRMAASIAQYAGRQVLSATKLIAADGEERIDMIVNAVRKLGNFEKMTAQQRLDIAQKMGVSASDLAKMMRGEQTEAQKKQETQRDLNKILKQSIKMADNMANAWKNLVNAIGPLVDVLRTVVGAFADFMALGGGAVGKIMVIAGALVFLGLKIYSLIPALGALGMGLQAGFLPFVIIPLIILGVVWALYTFRDSIGKVFGAIPRLISSGFDKIVGFFKEMDEIFFNAGANLVKMIASGIKSTIMAPVRAIKYVVGKVRGYLPFSPAKEGPLKDIMEVGPNIVKYIGQGITKNEDKVLKPMQNVVGGVSYIASAGPELLKESVKTMSSTNSTDVSNMKEVVRTARDTNTTNNNTIETNNNVKADNRPIILQIVVDSKVIKEAVLNDLLEQNKLSSILSVF